MEEKIEVLDENINNTTVNNDEIIPIDRLFDNNEEEIVIDAYEEDKLKEDERQKKITKIQIGLIIFLIIFASLIYFFGYNFLEPFIKID